MRLLLFSDLHRQLDVAQHLVGMSRHADVVIGAGDFATMRQGLAEMIDALARIDRPAVLVPGNSESYEELSAACNVWPTATVLHGSGVEIQGRSFWGVGGAIPTTPFGTWSYDLTEDEGRRLLIDCPSGGVLVSHAPPLGVVDICSRGQHLGSWAVLEAIERCAPALVVCGHIHESSGCTAAVRSTPVVNAGPTGILWELPAPGETPRGTGDHYRVRRRQ